MNKKKKNRRKGARVQHKEPGGLLRIAPMNVCRYGGTPRYVCGE